jgi:hypothetical protein
MTLHPIPLNFLILFIRTILFHFLSVFSLYHLLLIFVTILKSDISLWFFRVGHEPPGGFGSGAGAAGLISGGCGAGRRLRRRSRRRPWRRLRRRRSRLRHCLHCQGNKDGVPIYFFYFVKNLCRFFLLLDYRTSE